MGLYRFSPDRRTTVPDADGRTSHGKRLLTGRIAFRFSRIQTNIPVNLDFSIPAKYKRITFAQIIKSISNSQK